VAQVHVWARVLDGLTDAPLDRDIRPSHLARNEHG
jgi:hypothetical protein